MESAMNYQQFGSKRGDRDLTASEQQLLEGIRRRKADLLQEISKLQEEIDLVTRQMDTSTPAAPPLLYGEEPPGENGRNGETTSLHSGGGGSNSLKGDSLSVSSGNTLGVDTSKMMSMACKKFNMDPKKGIEYMVGNGLLKEKPFEVAQLLYSGEGLNKTAIGEFLGERNEFNEAVLKAFVSLHDFTDLILVQALRQFLWSFRLPGEAQKIDRMMESFAQRYCQCNPDIFNHTDTCYVLSFAIIMLNTSLHNPSVKEKPTVENFIAMNRGINNGGDLPRDLLVSLYNSIQSEPFKIPSEDDGYDLMGHTFFNPDKEGWLCKQGGRYKSWKRRWFILNDNCLYYFEFTTDKEPRGIIPLENVSVRKTGGDVGKGRFTFEIYSPNNSVIKACKTVERGKVVEGKHTVYRMSAGSEEERQDWFQCLSTSIKQSPFHELLEKRKVKVLKKDM